MTINMPLRACVLSCTLLCHLVVGASTSNNLADDDYEDTFTPYDGQRFDGFDWRLCKALDAREPGNVVISPVGIKLVLAMLYEGASNRTAQELATTLQLPVAREASREKFSAILKSLQQSNKQYVLDIGNKMYMDDDLNPRGWFAKTLKTYYNTDIEKVDFEQPSSAARSINSWVKCVTHGQIKDMVSDADLHPSTMLILLNAIYFKGTWRHPFLEEETRPGTFYVTPNNPITVSYMNVDTFFYYTESSELDAKILRLPYKGKKYSMFLVLPNARDGLTRLLNSVNPTVLRRQLWKLDEKGINVQLPKFEFQTSVDVGSILQQLGIREIFKPSAHLGAIARNQANSKLFVSNVIQKAGLEVNEKGTMAYGATDVTISNKFLESTPFVVDHPFMFFIEDEVTGTVVFVGKVVHPTPSNERSPIPTPSYLNSQPNPPEAIGQHNVGIAATRPPARYPLLHRPRPPANSRLGDLGGNLPPSTRAPSDRVNSRLGDTADNTPASTPSPQDSFIAANAWKYLYGGNWLSSAQ